MNKEKSLPCGFSTVSLYYLFFSHCLPFYLLQLLRLSPGTSGKLYNSEVAMPQMVYDHC